MRPSPLLLFVAAIHLVVGLWALVGLLEWIGLTPWWHISNPDLPRNVLALHWLAMAAAAATFSFGLWSRWPATPAAMIAAYVLLAAICAYETFTLLTSADRYTSMALEYLTYLVLGALWLRAPSLRRHFGVRNP